MGRKKIKIARIQDDRNRSVTYLKRKAGLMKKAHELAVLTGSDVAVIVFGQNGKLSEFCSGDIDRILLRYTEHTGPVERKGPENYQNDDDDGSDDDNMGDDGDDGDADSGDAGAGGSSSATRFGGHDAGSDSRNRGHRPSASNGSNRGGTDGGSSRASKRKAPRDKDATNAASFGALSSDPYPVAGAPIIKVEGDSDDSALVDDDNLEAGMQDAAYVRSSIRKQRSNSHHGGHAPQVRSRGYHHHSRSEQNIFSPLAFGVPNMHRPGSADVMRGPNAFVFPPPQDQKQSSPSPFAFNADMQSHPQHQQQSVFLGPQMWQSTPSSAAPPLSPQTSSLHPADAVTYGDLARGGNTGSGTTLSPMPSQHLQASSLTPQDFSPSPLPSPEVQALGHSAAYGNVNNLLPLAHPILRDHPQYEEYAARLRQQQQQQQQLSMHQRNASMPAFPISSQNGNSNFLAAPGASPANAISPAASAPPHSPAFSAVSLEHGYGGERRSASFGAGIEGGNTGSGAGAGRFVHQSSLSDVGPTTSSSFLAPSSAEQHEEAAAAGHYASSRPSSVMSSHSHHSVHQLPQSQQSFQQQQSMLGPSPGGQDDYTPLSSSNTSSAPPPPYASAQIGDQDGSNAMQQGSSDAHLSNAAFNDLMGSILSDMSPSSGAGTQSDGQPLPGEHYAMSSAAFVPGISVQSSNATDRDVKTQYFSAGSNNPTSNFRPFVGNAATGAEF